jgi:poly(3-hydroxybutyrate) depolymerase
LPISVLHIHGLSDTNHPIDGGRGTGVSGVEFRSGRDAVMTMATLDDCSIDPNFVTLLPNPDVEISTWSGCDSGVEVRLITVEGASHAWMGHSGISSGSSALVGEPYLEFDSSRAIWSFLAHHSRP